MNMALFFLTVLKVINERDCLDLTLKCGYVCQKCNLVPVVPYVRINENIENSFIIASSKCNSVVTVPG